MTKEYVVYEFTHEELEEMENDGVSIEDPRQFMAAKDYGSRMGSCETLDEAIELSLTSDRVSFVWDGRNWHNWLINKGTTNTLDIEVHISMNITRFEDIDLG